MLKHFFEKGHTFLVTLPLEIPDKMKFCPWKFHTIFFLIMPGNSTSFFIDSWSFQILFFQSPWKFHVLNSPPPPPLPLIFSGIAIEVVTASQTKICKLFWTRVYALDNEPKPYCLTFVLVFCQP